MNRSRTGCPGSGVTLIELLIALVIVAVLAAIAVPSYHRHTLRAQRTDATGALARAQAAQEKHFLEYNRYAANLEAPPPDGLGLRARSQSGLYDLKLVTSDDGSGFTIFATPSPGAGPEDDLRCRSLSIDQNGLRQARDAGGADTSEECWR